MIVHLIGRRALAVAPLVFLSLAPATSMDSDRQDTKRGYILDLLEGGRIKLEGGLVVRRTESTLISQKDRLYSGDLLIGLEVDVAGRFFGETGTLIADRITILTNLSGEVGGTAVVERREKEQHGLVLVADGRKLVITERLTLTPPKHGDVAALNDIALVQPGDFIRYRGRWTRNGLVDVAELSAWKNKLQEKEKEIYEKYDPKLLLPMREGSGPPVLKIDKNHYEVLDDQDLQLYLDQIGTQLLPEPWGKREWTEPFGYRFWFLAAVHEKPQASAFPSGVVVVHSSLFHYADNEAQLAFAVAHEIAHVIQEHAWQQYRYHREKLLLLRWSTAGIGYAVESAIRRGYRRDLEAQADRLALWYMAEAGYDPREGIKLMRRLEAEEGLSALFWDTHRGYRARERALIKELVHYSTRGLAYSHLRRTSPAFVRFQHKIPSAKIQAIQ